MAVVIAASINAGQVTFGKASKVTFSRAIEPEKFWCVVSIYALMTIVLAFVLWHLPVEANDSGRPETAKRDWMGNPIEKPKK